MSDSSKSSAAHAVLAWLNTHPYEREIALRYAAAGPQHLGNWVRQTIYPPSFLHLHPDDARKMIALRDSFTREDFDRIDWPSVWFELTRDDDQKIVMHTWYNQVSPRPGYHYAEEISSRTYEDDMVQNREWSETVYIWAGEDRTGIPLTVVWLTQPRFGMATLYAYEIQARGTR